MPRLSRRTTTLAAVAAIATTLSRTGTGQAQDAATPVTGPEATPEAEDTGLLFVQSFTASTLGPGEDSGLWTLALSGSSGQTLYFSERPNRLVGTIDTGPFIEAFRDETASDPANAAVVAQVGATDEVTFVVELVGMVFDAATGDLTYTVRLLGDPSVLEMVLPEAPLMEIGGPAAYDATQIFIDAGGLMQLVAYGAQD
jgi:hypothetical protein